MIFIFTQFVEQGHRGTFVAQFRQEIHAVSFLVTHLVRKCLAQHFNRSSSSRVLLQRLAPDNLRVGRGMFFKGQLGMLERLLRLFVVAVLSSQGQVNFRQLLVAPIHVLVLQQLLGFGDRILSIKFTKPIKFNDGIVIESIQISFTFLQ